MIKGVLLDVDGTLLDTERIFMESWLRAGKEYGYPLTYEQVLSFHGKGIEDNGKTFRSWFGEQADYYKTRALRQRYTEEILARDGVPVKPGLFPFLDFLKSRDIKIALATSTIRKEAPARWEKAGLLPYVDASVCGDEVTNSKPHPEIFLKAAALLSLAPEECMVFEDSHAGLRAGRASGAQVCMVPDMEPVTDEIRPFTDYICPSLLEACTLLREIL